MNISKLQLQNFGTELHSYKAKLHNNKRNHSAYLLAGVFSVSCLLPSAALSQTINQALATAYENNVTLKAQRASARAVDEGVPIARSGFLPNISGNVNYGHTKQEHLSEIKTGTFGVSISQLLFDGFKTSNNVNAAKAQVRAAHYTLQNTEQDVLLNAASAFSDVVRDAKLVNIRRKNLAFLKEQLRVAKSRLNVGEGTRTEVAQADAQLAASQAQLSLAKTNYQNSKAIYRQMVGVEAKKLTGSGRLNLKMPKTLETSIRSAYLNHPALLASEELVNVMIYNVESAKGDLYPTLSVTGSASKNYVTGQPTSGSITAQLNIPIYQGGRVAAEVRQRKEQLREQELQVEVTKDSVRANVVRAWTSLQAAKASVRSSRAQIKAAKLALNGEIDERKLGQKTTLDVLNAQQTLLNAEDGLINASRNVSVGRLSLISAMGKLTASDLRLSVEIYEPKRHADAVKDKWFGLRTVD